MNSMNEKQLIGMLGLAMRAGQLKLGVDMSADYIRHGQAEAAFIDQSASENAKKRLQDTAEFYKIPLYELPEGLLDEASGKSGRMAAAVSHGGIAKQIIKIVTANQSQD